MPRPTPCTGIASLGALFSSHQQVLTRFHGFLQGREGFEPTRQLFLVTDLNSEALELKAVKSSEAKEREEVDQATAVGQEHDELKLAGLVALTAIRLGSLEG